MTDEGGHLDDLGLPGQSAQYYSRYDACTHCRRMTTKSLRSHHPYPVAMNTGGGFHLGVCFIAECMTCSGILVYKAAWGEYPEDFPTSPVVWPPSRSLHKSVPESISRYYDEAWRVQLLSPDSFVVQIRRALEAVCTHQGVAKGRLAARLRKLRENERFPPTMAELSDSLRILGNIAAHHSAKPLTIDESKLVDHAFRAVIEYLYIIPARLDDVRHLLLKSATVADDQTPDEPDSPATVG